MAQRPLPLKYSLDKILVHDKILEHAAPREDYATLADRSEALGGGTSPGAGLSLSDSPNPNALDDSCNRICL